MGMFDTFIVHQLGDIEFQTKDLDCKLDCYKIASNGVVLKKHYEDNEYELCNDLDMAGCSIVIYDRQKYFKLYIRNGICIAIYGAKENQGERDWQIEWKLIWPK